MNETTKNQITSALTSIIGVLGMVPAAAKFLPPSLTSQLPDIVNAIGVLVGAAALIWKLIPKSQASIAKGAIEQGSIKQIITTPELAVQVNHPDVVAR